ncbi:MAG: YwaF family protein [Clostridia bacterium]|nr:YwaF family protein [Clostridia bacterium]
MIYAIMVLGIAMLLFALIFIEKKFPKKIHKWIKIITFIFILTYAFRLLNFDKFDNIIGLQCDYMSKGMVAWMMLLKTMLPVATIVTAIEPFRTTYTTKNILRFFVPVVTLLNIIMYKQNLMMFFGTSNVSAFTLRGIFFATELIFMGGISAYYLYKFIINFEKSKRYLNPLKCILAILGLMIACLPVNFFQTLFGIFGEEALDFNFTHRAVIYLSFIIPLLIYFGFRRKSKEECKTLLIYLATSCLITFCYTIDINSLNYTNLPLHLCNTGVFLIFIAFVFNIKSIYYFTFFVNVIGALFAMFMPNYSGSLFIAENIRFWYNHMYVFFLPVLAMVLKVFPRPTFKMIKGAIGVFTIYFISMIIANAWINTFASVDYFFLQGDTISKHAQFLTDWKNLYIWKVVIRGVAYSTSWLFDIFVYVGYVFLMFIIWLVYDYLFKAQDHYTRLNELDKIDMLNIRQLKKRLNGDLTLPINIRGKNMINISHFTKIYAGSDKKAVDNFSLKVKNGQVFGFIGHNGAGKSTLIKSLVGIQSITGGKIEVCGYDITKQPLQAKLNIGYVSDNHAVYEKLTGREYLNYVADLYLVSKQDREERIERYSKMFHLENDLDREIKGYSHGMKQKLVVIASIIHNPKVWVLDEPLTGLDPVSSHQIKSLMRKMADEGHIVFFSSHVIEVLEKLCDRVAIIKQGKLVGEYSSEELKAKKMSLEDIYLDSADDVVEDDVKSLIVAGNKGSKESN